MHRCILIRKLALTYAEPVNATKDSREMKETSNIKKTNKIERHDKDEKGLETISQVSDQNTLKGNSSTFQKERSIRKTSTKSKVINRPVDLTKVESKIRDKVYQDRQRFSHTANQNQDSVGNFVIRPEGLANRIEPMYDSVDQSEGYVGIKEFLQQGSILDVAEQVINSPIICRLMQTRQPKTYVIKTGPDFYKKTKQAFLSQEGYQMRITQDQLYSNKHSFKDLVRIRDELSPKHSSNEIWNENGNVFMDTDSYRAIPKHDLRSKRSSKISYGFARQ